MRSVPYRWSIVALLCAISTISYVGRVNVTVVGDYLMRDYQIEQTQMGGIFTAFLLGYTAALRVFPENSS